MSGTARLRVLLVDDQVLFVESLKSVLEERAPDFELVGIAHDGNEAVFQTMRLRPDVILMDVRMPHLDGVQATRKIHELYPKIKILVLTAFDDDDYVDLALKFGATGYLLKNIPPNELIQSVRAVGSGVSQMAPEIVGRLVSRGHATGSEALEPVAVLETLTRREQEILQLVVSAYENSQIAELLDVSEQTVKNHIHHLYEKLGVSNRVQLIKVLNHQGS